MGWCFWYGTVSTGMVNLGLSFGSQLSVLVFTGFPMFSCGDVVSHHWAFECSIAPRASIKFSVFG